MKTKSFIPPIIVLLIGVLCSSAGVVFKILHWEFGFLNGGVLLAIGSLLEAIGIVWVIVILIRAALHKKN